MTNQWWFSSDPTLIRLSEQTWWWLAGRCSLSSWRPPWSLPPSSCPPSSRMLSVISMFFSDLGFEFCLQEASCLVWEPSVFFAINPPVLVFSLEKHDPVHKYEKFIRNNHNWEVLEKKAFKVLCWKNNVNLKIKVMFKNCSLFEHCIQKGKNFAQSYSNSTILLNFI